jgi:hypothetical protein
MSSGSKQTKPANAGDIKACRRTKYARGQAFLPPAYAGLLLFLRNPQLALRATLCDTLPRATPVGHPLNALEFGHFHTGVRNADAEPT